MYCVYQSVFSLCVYCWVFYVLVTSFFNSNLSLSLSSLFACHYCVVFLRIITQTSSIIASLFHCITLATLLLHKSFVYHINCSYFVNRTDLDYDHSLAFILVYSFHYLPCASAKQDNLCGPVCPSICPHVHCN